MLLIVHLCNLLLVCMSIMCSDVNQIQTVVLHLKNKVWYSGCLWLWQGLSSSNQQKHVGGSYPYISVGMFVI